MKIKVILFLTAFLIILASCKPGEIRVKNEISNVVITDVRWGDNLIALELLPGQVSKKLVISNDAEKLPASFKISFIMKANQQSVYLRTVEEFMLQKDEEILITLTDETEVETL